MNKAAIIVNPNAGNKKLVENIHEVVKRLEEKYSKVIVYETKEVGDGGEFLTKIAGEVDLVIGAGGDGTVYELVNALCPLKKRPLFAILPGGTCNDFSRAIGMDQDPFKAVEQILEHKVEQLDVGHCNADYFLNFWGVGLITQVSTNIDSQVKDRFGRLSYYLSAAQTLKDYESFNLEIESPDFTYQGDAAMLIVGNGPFTGGVRAFFPDTDIQDGKFDILIVKEPSLRLIWDALQSKLLKQIPSSEEIHYYKTGRLKVKASPGQLIDCDGERHAHTPAEMVNLEKYLSVIVGNFPS
ncbi:diacylglycerol/lipid kinase family protein [Fictibacillus terranigra]|uniref:Diacylglycerol kinase family lipid kinase n=1 Tax=Fictibacillus terranigra TaxID=3058424 RepID=A0ABT8ED32_9BACL|nr:diacylglycerol kinase family protein [Fictibacillus sp. CENA-BCM004]MDN4075727.1 diacylglycerol kinase family lipid kinase [Fictibacillus sp. CENA-BCM004]